MQEDLTNLKRRVMQYQEVLENTNAYRNIWKESMKEDINGHLREICQGAGLDADIKHVAEMENLEAIVLSLGTVKSGMSRQLTDDIQRHFIKHNGSLVYQQLFNGKIIVLINYPYIENYGKPHPPKTIAIYRPNELRPPFYVRHVETLLQEITLWEDYDDDIDNPNQRIGFKLNFESAEGSAPVH